MPINENVKYEEISNEPKVRTCIQKSFAFVQSAGMRHAPEILLVELLREVFYPLHYEKEKPSGGQLDPDEHNEDRTFLFSQKERAIIHALRGRRKKTKKSKSFSFYAPAYFSLARKAYLGQKRERVILNFLLGGPIAQFLWQEGDTIDARKKHTDFSSIILKALIGHNSRRIGESGATDIFSLPLGEALFPEDESACLGNIQEKTQSERVWRLSGLVKDELSTRITNDFIALCKLEVCLPRMQWINLLMTFLRFSLPMWLLAQMRITSLLHGWFIDSMQGLQIPTQEEIVSAIRKRNLDLLRPTVTPTREIYESTELYIKRRVELNILLANLETVTPTGLLSGSILVIESTKANHLTIESALVEARDAAKKFTDSAGFKEVVEGGSLKDFLTRESERFPAWRDPLNNGQGKNIDEFFRVMYRDEQGDEQGGFLLNSEGRGRGRGFRVFPGQMLLKTVAFLSAHEKKDSGLVKGGGRLVLEDLENHFRQYGIDFDHAADARPRLIGELQAMGLLMGSPDAGSSVAIANPFSF